jgi:hypothetical protein
MTSGWLAILICLILGGIRLAYLSHLFNPS